MEENIRTTEAQCHGDTRSLFVFLWAYLSQPALTKEGWFKKQLEIFSVVAKNDERKMLIPED